MSKNFSDDVKERRSGVELKPSVIAIHHARKRNHCKAATEVGEEGLVRRIEEGGHHPPRMVETSRMAGNVSTRKGCQSDEDSNGCEYASGLSRPIHLVVEVTGDPSPPPTSRHPACC